jgi:hypothetical protein
MTSKFRKRSCHGNYSHFKRVKFLNADAHNLMDRRLFTVKMPARLEASKITFALEIHTKRQLTNAGDDECPAEHTHHFSSYRLGAESDEQIG